MDDIDGDLTSRIVAASNVDTKTLGIYNVTYNVSDRSGNAAPTVKRTVNVTPQATAQEGAGGGGALGLELAAVFAFAAWRARRRALLRARPTVKRSRRPESWLRLQ